MDKRAVKNNKLIILLHEIYGVNNHIKFIKTTIEKFGYDVICPNMINRQPYDYSQEVEAYNHYIDDVGFESCFNKVKKLIDNNNSVYEEIYVIGFSVGATVAWICSELNINGVICIYGTRIRDFLKVNPKCPVLTIFASMEKSFEVDKIVNELETKNNIEVIVIQGKHGFADPFSNSYDSVLFKQTINTIINFLILKGGKPSGRIK